MAGLKYLLLSFLFITLNYSVYATRQPEGDTIKQNNDIMLFYGLIDYSAEFYQVDKRTSLVDHHILYQPLLDDNNILNFEFGIVESIQEEGTFTTPSDVKIGYRRNFKPREQMDNGYDGSYFGAKLILPTGRDEYFSGFDSWTIEPNAGFQWKLWNANTLTGLQLKYSYSFAALPDKKARNSFFRAEPYTGYENNRYWAFVAFDYRFIPSKVESNIFASINVGFKFNEHWGIKGKFKPRIAGESFYEEMYVIGAYFYL